MKINVHIERLVLEGIPVASNQEVRLREAVEQELRKRLADNGISSRLRTRGETSALRAGTIHLSSENDPTNLGAQIGQSVYEGIRR